MKSRAHQERLQVLSLIRIDRDRALAVRFQLYEQLRAAIASGRVVEGTALPSTRQIARAFGLSRSIVTEAVEMLAADGLVVPKRGSGTFAARCVVKDRVFDNDLAWDHLSQAAQRMKKDADKTPDSIALERCFMPAMPSLDRFPNATWAQLTSRVLRAERSALLSYAQAGGHAALRDAIAAHARLALGIECFSEQVVIVDGSQQAWDLLARLLVDHGEDVWVEEPGEPAVASAFVASGARVVPVTVDADGLHVASSTSGRKPRVIHVTPIAHWPLGVVLTQPRRERLLQFAAENDIYIVESDFNTEYRFAGSESRSLAAVDSKRVIHVSSFSLTLFPGLRLGYMIVPPELVAPVLAAKRVMHRESGLLQQAVLAMFILEGHYGEYLRECKELYGARRAHLARALRVELSSEISVEVLDCGLHMVATFAGHDALEALILSAADRGVVVWPTRQYYRLGPPPAAQAMLGFACVDETAIDKGVRVLRDCLLEKR
jgi:GntR family transcriptional regulator/MocR family aminotransferase